VGAAGSRLEIVSVALPDSGVGAQMLEGDPQKQAAALVQKLRTEARVL
jgi:electron transfer flavoprotein alpha/beta subunit